MRLRGKPKSPEDQNFLPRTGFLKAGCKKDQEIRSEEMPVRPKRTRQKEEVPEMVYLKVVKSKILVSLLVW